MKDVIGSDRVLIWEHSAFAWRNQGKPRRTSAEIFGVPAEIRTHVPQNINEQIASSLQPASRWFLALKMEETSSFR
jgi:hypothetical protein